MAIKKISFNKEGLVSEETIEKKASQPPKPEKKKKAKVPKTKKPRKGSAKGTDVPETKPVKITSTVEKKASAQPGQSLIEKDVIKFKCPRCSSERVAGSKDTRLKCGLCGAAMKHEK